MTTKKRVWFRVLVDASGKAVDCRPVSDEGAAEGGVFYILAETAQAAAQQAINAHAAKLLAARRARHVSQGRCKCGRDRDRKDPAGGFFKTCSGCDSRHKVHEERARARARGEQLPPLDRRVVLQERKESESLSVRLGVLEEVRAAWRQHNTVGGFTRWLEQEIQKLAGRKVA